MAFREKARADEMQRIFEERMKEIENVRKTAVDSEKQNIYKQSALSERIGTVSRELEELKREKEKQNRINEIKDLENKRLKEELNAMKNAKATFNIGSPRMSPSSPSSMPNGSPGGGGDGDDEN